MNQAANQRFAFDAINGGGRSVFGGSDRLWDSVTNPGKGMLENAHGASVEAHAAKRRERFVGMRR